MQREELGRFQTARKHLVWPHIGGIYKPNLDPAIRPIVVPQTYSPCRLIMAHTTIEEQKEAYARELAAHTLQQWNAIRRSLDGEKSGEDSSSSTSTTPDEYDHLRTGGNSKVQTPHNADGE